MAALDLALRIFTLLVAAAGVIVASLGLQTWRRQLHGQFQFDLARRMALAVYKVRNRIENLRLGMGVENAERLLSQLSEAMAELETSLLEAEVVWGKSVNDIKKGLVKCVNELWLSVRRYLRMTRDEAGRPPDPKRDEARAAEFSKLDSIVYGTESDEFGGKVNQAVADFENYLRPHLPTRRRFLADWSKDIEAFTCDV